MKITELDFTKEGKRYKCGNSMFVIKNGDLFDVEMYTYLKDSCIPVAELVEMEFEEIKEMKNPYERVKCGEKYRCLFGFRIHSNKDSNHEIDNKLFSIANYFSNRDYAEYIAFKETLMRKLDRFAWEHNARVMNWDKNVSNYCIIFDNQNKDVETMVAYAYQSNDVYFTSREIAEQAIEEFKDDLIKLYTWKFDF